MILASAFLLGLFSSLHCIGMCGPLQAVVTGAFHSKARPAHIALYHLSRILTYSLLGLLAGFLGRGLGLQSWQQNASLLSGLFLLFALAAFYFLKLDRKLLKLLFPYLSRMRTRLQQKRSSRNLYYSGSGVLNGLLPCGMVYLAIVPATAIGNPLQALFFMFLFGTGTLPLLFLTNMGAFRFLQSRAGWIQKLIPAFVMITALLLILRGMDLGIPYLSPQLPVHPASVQSCN